MSKLLALDTSSDYCSVALFIDNKIIELKKHAPRQHTQLLLPMVDEILAQENLCLNNIDAIGFGVGPGSFTGLRICFSIVQGLAFGAGIPVVPVSTLAAMANSLVHKSQLKNGSRIFPCLDARMSQVYWGAYEYSEENGLLELIDDSLDSPEIAASKMTSLLGSHGNFLCGPGDHYEPLQEFTAVNKPSDDHAASSFSDPLIEPWAGSIVQLAQNTYAKSGGQDIRNVQPVYLRNEITWEKRKRIRT